MRKFLGPCLLVLLLAAGLHAGNNPSLDQVVANPQDYAGQNVAFNGLTLSGNIFKYDYGNVRKYYLTAASRNKTYEPGFLLAPPDLADKLYEAMNPRRNYGVNLTCKVVKVTINDSVQWHGIVSRVDFLDGDGNVTSTLRAAEKKGN